MMNPPPTTIVAEDTLSSQHVPSSSSSSCADQQESSHLETTDSEDHFFCPMESNDSSIMNMSTSWIDIENDEPATVEDQPTTNDAAEDSSNNNNIEPSNADDAGHGEDTDFFDALESAATQSTDTNENKSEDESSSSSSSSSSTSTTSLHDINTEEEEDDACETHPDISDDPFVTIVETHVETAEGHDWEGILGLRDRLKEVQQQNQDHRHQQQQQHHHQQQHSSKDNREAARRVLEYSLYLTGDDHVPLEDASAEASSALANAPQYDILEEPCIGQTDGAEGDDEERDRPETKQDTADFVEFVKKNTSDSAAEPFDDENDEAGYASLDLSPLDVLANILVNTSLSNANKTTRIHSQQTHFLQLAELIVGGPNLQLSERGIDRLAEALVGSSRGLRKLVLSVAAADTPAMESLATFFRSPNGKDLRDLSFYARRATQRLVGARNMSRTVPTQAVLGPGLSSWVDAWTAKQKQPPRSHSNHLRSLNLARMDIGDEGALALSRLLLVAPKLKTLQLAQNDDDIDAFGSSRDSQWNELQERHPPLSFVGTRRLLESLILVEDLKKQNRTSECASLLELNLSGWVLEDTNNTADDDKVVDNYYDDYNYIDGDNDNDFGDDDFEYTSSTNDSTVDRVFHPRERKRPSSVVASMLRVNTSLQRLILANEGGSMSSYRYTGRLPRSTLSVRSTLAIARALRDHISVISQPCTVRPIGSNLKTLVLSTNYSSNSSWATKERKRSVGRVFYHSLKDRPIHQVSLQELSCTLEFKDLEPFVPDTFSTTADEEPRQPKDLKEQLESLLQSNRKINQSLKRIHSFWIPKLSSLSATDGNNSGNQQTNHTDDNDNDDDDCEFVVKLEGSSSNPEECVTTLSRPPRLRSKRPPIDLLILPDVLAIAGRETAGLDVVFHIIQSIAETTCLWEAATEYVAARSSRYTNHARS